MKGHWLVRYASWSAYVNGAFALLGLALTGLQLTIGGPWRLLSDLTSFVSSLGLLPIPLALHQLGRRRSAAISLLGAAVGVLGALVTVIVQASGLLGLRTSEQQAGPLVVAIGAIGAWMVLSNHLARIDRRLSVGLAWLGVVAGVGLLLTAALLGLGGFRAMDLAALPHSDRLTALGLVMGVLAHVASLAWALWLGRELQRVGAVEGTAAVGA